MNNVENDIRQILRELPSEGPCIDYKQIPYLKNKRHDFVKDVIAMLNSFESIGKPRYIIFGVTDKKELVGIKTELQIDDNEYQNLADKISPRPMVNSGTFLYNDLTFGYIYVMGENERVVYEACADVIGNKEDKIASTNAVFKGQAFLRRGSRNEVLMENDRERIISQKGSSFVNQQKGTVDFVIIPKCEATSILMLLGMWNENCTGDKKVVELLYGKEYSSFLPSMRKLHSENPGMLKYNTGIWKAQNRNEILKLSANDIYDDHISCLKKAAIEVVAYTDPYLNLEDSHAIVPIISNTESQYVYSDEIRKGIFEFFAYAENNIDEFVNCSSNSIGLAINEIETAIIQTESWKVWETTADIHVILAEMYPLIFLREMEQAVGDRKNALIEFVKAKDHGTWRRTYGGELCDALGMLAMYSDYFSKAAGIMLFLGQYNDVFLDRLVTIMLPWDTQTEASIDAMIGFLKAEIKELPDAVWTILLKLLPGKTTTSYRLRQPSYHKKPNIPEERTLNDYIAYEDALIALACKCAWGNSKRLCEMLEILENTTEQQREEILKMVESSFKEMNEEDSYCVWDALTDVLARHRRFSGAEWALPQSELDKIDSLLAKVENGIPLSRERKMFRNNQWDLLDDEDLDYAEAESRLHKIQNDIASKLYLCSWEAVYSFVAKIEKPELFGKSLAEVALDDEVISRITEDVFSDDNGKIRFATGYIKKAYEKSPDKVSRYIFSLADAKKIRLMSILPINDENVEIVKASSDELQEIYWKNALTYNLEIKDIECFSYVIRSLSFYRRVEDAVELLYFRIAADKEETEALTVYDVLVMCEPESYNRTNTHEIEVLIKFVQQSNIESEKKKTIELKYLDMMLRERTMAPIVLFDELSDSPEKYVELVLSLHKKESSEVDLEKHSQMYSLLRAWKGVPGLKKNGEFDEDKFKSWMDYVLKKADLADCRDFVESQVGEMLYHVPVDRDGFFIMRVAADYLQADVRGHMRTGYLVEAFNSRNGHIVDGSGKPEFELEEKYSTLAQEAENNGYPRLADTLRALAREYHNEALYNIEEAKKWNNSAKE